MIEASLEICPDCKVALPPVRGGGHAYLGASPSCWALYGQVLAREYASPELMRVHRLTVDAYAAQHPGQPERRSIQSVWIHLSSLYLALDRGVSHDFARRVISSLTALREPLAWLEPPESLGNVTVIQAYEATDPVEHRAVIRQWAESVWAAWKPHRQTIAMLADRAAYRL